jgi:hypothetical protein
MSYLRQNISSMNVKILQSAPMCGDGLMHPYYWKLIKSEYDAFIFLWPVIPPDQQMRLSSMIHKGQIIDALDYIVFYTGSEAMLGLLRKIKAILKTQKPRRS